MYSKRDFGEFLINCYSVPFALDSEYIMHIITYGTNQIRIETVTWLRRSIFCFAKCRASDMSTLANDVWLQRHFVGSVGEKPDQFSKINLAWVPSGGQLLDATRK